MRRLVGVALILLLAVVHGPTQAQALLFFDLLLPPHLVPLATNEPAMLLLTGAALLALARLGAPRRRGEPALPAGAPRDDEAPAAEGSPAERAA